MTTGPFYRLRTALQNKTTKTAFSQDERMGGVLGVYAGGLGSMSLGETAGRIYKRELEKKTPEGLRLSSGRIASIQSALGFKRGERMPIFVNPDSRQAYYTRRPRGVLETGELLSKSGPVDFPSGREGYKGSHVMLGGGGLTRADVLAHELGHATVAQQDSGLLRRLNTKLYGRGALGSILGMSSLMFDEDNNLKYAPIAAAAALQVPTLAEEAIATKKGLKALEKAGLGDTALKAARRRLGAAYATYLAGALGYTAIPAAALYGKENWGGTWNSLKEKF